MAGALLGEGRGWGGGQGALGTQDCKRWCKQPCYAVLWSCTLWHSCKDTAYRNYPWVELKPATASFVAAPHADEPVPACVPADPSCLHLCVCSGEVDGDARQQDPCQQHRAHGF